MPRVERFMENVRSEFEILGLWELIDVTGCELESRKQ